ncbi:hypothetical protein [Microbacterium sp. NPDC087591]|jgi:hypothetical protein|uniref:hypothetical protein n=1 Tax=Microbacterium sp. NPDC087591 TaxID=3364192 RepID=UPI0037FBC2D1
MTEARAAAVLFAILFAVTGCANPPSQQAERSIVTWEEAKAMTKSTTLEIVDLIPSQTVVGVDQHETGTLFSCDGDRHSWTGITFVTVQPGTDIEAIIKRIEPNLQELLGDRGSFSVTNRLDFFGDYAVSAQSSTTSEAYLLGLRDGDTLVIDSWSECFTLPEGTYPGGKF